MADSHASWSAEQAPCSARIGLALRSCEPEDQDFLEQLYGTTRAAELARTGWSDARCREFVAQQFRLQQAYYRAHFPEADFLMLLAQGQRLGRLYWWEGVDRAVLVDMALLPQACGQGRGTALLQDLIARADTLGLDVELHVEPFNPALRLYRRFGFEVLSDNGIHAKLRRSFSQVAALCG